MPISLTINGQNRDFAELSSTSSLQNLVDQLGLKPDRIALEHNGELAPRSTWGNRLIQPGDRLELVHFVGGGIACTHNETNR